MNPNANQLDQDPSMTLAPVNMISGNQMPMNQQMQEKPTTAKSQGLSDTLARIPSLYLPALLLLAFTWLLHTIATFIPYWSTYNGIADSRAGLWSARYFTYTSIQNFYFPESTDFPNLTNSITFTTANTKGYLVTVQFLMTFNFVVMLIVLILLGVDFIASRRSPNQPRSFLIRSYNTSDTGIKFGLLLYIIYVFGVFEFAAWITYVGSRHDDNWNMHVSFAFAVIVSIFLIVIFGMYVIEFMRTFQKNRMKWEYWYGPYIQWGFFIYLTALLLLLIVICCPEWAYSKLDALYLFAEIGLFKQCLLSAIYKKSVSSGLCTLSDSRSNQSWVNATQAFTLMAYIIGMILLIIIVVFRKEFRHDPEGYYADRVSQPKFTYVMAGLILFFCFIFTLIAVSIFGGEVFPNGLTANWGYIIAIFAMILFLVAGILFILDAVHSHKQTEATESPEDESFFFPAPLSSRVLTMQSKPRPETPPPPPPMPRPPRPISSPPALPRPWPTLQQPLPFYLQQQGAFATPGFDDTPFFPPPPNYPMNEYPNAPLTQAAIIHSLQQAQNNPQLIPYPYNEGSANHLAEYPNTSNNVPNYRSNNNTNNNLIDMLRQQAVQQQRLNYNHDRLLERYHHLTNPHVSTFRTFGTSSLPGRNYNDYLSGMNGDQLNESALVAASRAGIGSSDETYQWMGDELPEPLPRGVSSRIQDRRNEPFPNVRAENFEPLKMHYHSIFEITSAYIRSIFKKTKHLKKASEESEQKVNSNDSDIEIEKEINPSVATANDNQQEISDHIPSGYVTYMNWKTRHENLMLVNPPLFNIYTHRSNGSIDSYGQSLYAPSIYHRNRIPRSPTDIDSNLDDASLEPFSSSLGSRYHKLHSRSPLTTVLYRPVDSTFTSESVSSSSNLDDTPNIVFTTTKSESSAASTSVISHPTSSSSVNKNSPVVTLFSNPRTASETQILAISSEAVSTDELVSHAKLTSNDSIAEDDVSEKQRQRQKKTELSTATDATSVDTYPSLLLR